MRHVKLTTLALLVLFGIVVRCGKDASAQQRPCSVPVPDQVFCDDFSGQNLDDQWSVSSFFPQGDIRLENGVTLETASRGAFSLIAKDVTLGNTSIQTQVMLSSNATGIDLVGIAARRNDASNQSYFAGITANGFLFISREPGNTVWTASVPFNPLETDVKLQFDLFDNELSLRAWRPNEPMPAMPQVSVSNDTYDIGIIGLVVEDNEGPGMLSGSFRYVQVATSPIPEPSSLVLCLTGLFGISRLRRPNCRANGIFE